MPDDAILALAETNGVVYIGGPFQTVGGKPRKYLAALDSRSGQVMPWNPDVKVTVTAMVISDKTIYVGGIPHGAATSVVAAYDLETGLSPTAWNGFVEGITIEGLLPWVWVLRVSGDTLFVGGENIGLSSGPSTTFIPLLALDARTGQIRSWRPWGPNQKFYDAVSAIQVVGSSVYVGGSFSELGGQVRSNLASLDRETAAALPWNPTADGRVRSLAVLDNRVFVAGDFTSVSSQSRSGLAAVEVADGSVIPWDPIGTNVNAIRALALAGNTVYVAGTFRNIGSQSRTNLAALDASTGNVMAWNPSVTNQINVLVVSGDTVYAGGGLDFPVNGSSYPYLGVFPPRGWSVLSQPQLNTGAVGFRLLGEEGSSYVIEASATLTNWSSVYTNTVANGGFDYSEPATNTSPRFYRAVSGQ